MLMQQRATSDPVVHCARLLLPDPCSRGRAQALGQGPRLILPLDGRAASISEPEIKARGATNLSNLGLKPLASEGSCQG